MLRSLKETSVNFLLIAYFSSLPVYVAGLKLMFLHFLLELDAYAYVYTTTVRLQTTD